MKKPGASAGQSEETGYRLLSDDRAAGLAGENHTGRMAVAGSTHLDRPFIAGDALVADAHVPGFHRCAFDRAATHGMMRPVKRAVFGITISRVTDDDAERPAGITAMMAVVGRCLGDAKAKDGSGGESCKELFHVRFLS